MRWLVAGLIVIGAAMIYLDVIIVMIMSGGKL